MIDSLLEKAGDLPQRLALRLKSPPPGKQAQRRFAPSLGYGRHHGPAPQDAREAAVLMLLYFDDGWRLPMTLRPDTLPSHAGQVSFPGGMIDPGETVEQAAVRELEEELGVPGEAVEVLGRLSPLYVWASNFHVTPVLATMEATPEFIPSPEEVAEVIDVPLAAVVDPAFHHMHTINRRGLVFHAPHIEIDRHRIWGASCMMLGELAALLEEAASS
ncbi:MAG: CoA pyrophosphatase [Pirellulaceae bacterium]